MKTMTILSAVAALSLSTAYAATSYDGNGQVPEQFRLSGKPAAKLHDFTSVNLATAEKLAKACEDIARQHNSQVVVAIYEPSGLPVYIHRMDGNGYVSLLATQQKALTALKTRNASHAIANRNAQDPFTNQNMAGYNLTTQSGGLPIIVNGQLIGSIGVGGIPPAERTPTYDEEKCARDALEKVIGPQPALLPDVAARRPNQGGGGAGPRGNGAPNQ